MSFHQDHLTIPRLRARVILVVACLCAEMLCAATAAAKPDAEPIPAKPGGNAPQRIYIREIRVLGARNLPPIEIEQAVYPFLGPGRAIEDVEGARAALEKAYHDKGFSATQVTIPEQTGRGGLVLLQVIEGRVGMLRVKGARYFLPGNIRRQAPSLAPGKLVNFNDVQKDIIALNQLADRKVTPSIRAGGEPGTVDVDLNVEDKLPLHGTVELNNRHSANTVPLRLNASVNYNNLWQLGHSVGASVQIAPERARDARVVSGYYTARFPGYSDASLMFTATRQDSDVSTLGGANSIGRGEMFGLHAIFTLPPPLGSKGFYHSLNLGFDYKHFDERVRFAATDIFTPITYFPLSAAYGATWAGKGQSTDLNLSANFHARGMGDNPAAFDSKRFKADGSYIYLRGDLSHSHDLPGGFQIFAKAQAQIADQPLLNTEQFSAGGESTVRGYLESAALGDNGFLGSVELRSPPLGTSFGKWLNEWRIYAFFEGGTLTLNEPLPEQQSHFTLASYGFGTRVRLANHFNGALEFGMPLYNISDTRAGEGLVTFGLSADF